jgi:short-subunit dehydrogenase
MKTVLITGTSSGIGKKTALFFSKKGWNVIATMRKPELEKELIQFPNIKVIECDVTDPESIRSAVQQGIETFGKIDVLVNNAGFYTIGVLEAATEEQIDRQLQTNLFGLIHTTKEVLPHFRKQRAGTIINISSVAGQISVPLQSLYHATKWGVEGFSESLQYELRPFNIRVKIIQPGAIKTNFTGSSMTIMKKESLEEYSQYAHKVINNLIMHGENGSCPDVVARKIYNAAISNSKKMRYPVGKNKYVLVLRELLPTRIFFPLMNMTMQK